MGISDPEMVAIQYWVALSEARYFDARDIKEHMTTNMPVYEALQHIQRAKTVAAAMGLIPMDESLDLDDWRVLAPRA